MGLQQAGGEAGNGVGLVDSGRDPLLCRRPDHRVAGVAASTHHQVGRKLLEQSPGLPRGTDQVPQRDEIMADFLWLQGAVKAGYLHRPEGPACLLNELSLDAAMGPYKQYFTVGPPLANQSRQGQSWIHMSCGASAGKNHFHLLSLPWAPGSGGTRRAPRPPPPAEWQEPCRRN